MILRYTHNFQDKANKKELDKDNMQQNDLNSKYLSLSSLLEHLHVHVVCCTRWFATIQMKV